MENNPKGIERQKTFKNEAKAKSPNILPPIYAGDEEEVRSFNKQYQPIFKQANMNVYHFNKYI